MFGLKDDIYVVKIFDLFEEFSNDSLIEPLALRARTEPPRIRKQEETK